MEWEEKAEWLRSNGYHLVIEEIDIDGCKWMAHISGIGRRYADTIPNVVSLVYRWVKAEKQFDTPCSKGCDFLPICMAIRRRYNKDFMDGVFITILELGCLMISDYIMKFEFRNVGTTKIIKFFNEDE